LNQFKDYVNLNVLGKHWRKGILCLTTTHNSNTEKRIGDQGMPNCMEAFDKLDNNFLWYDEDRKEQWKKLIANWWKLTEMACQRENFSDKEINAMIVLN
jgi:hypothetical protein